MSSPQIIPLLTTESKTKPAINSVVKTEISETTNFRDRIEKRGVDLRQHDRKKSITVNVE